VTLDVRFRPHECTRTAELFRRSCDLDRRQQKTRVDDYADVDVIVIHLQFTG
jgi:hypothetical protein